MRVAFLHFLVGLLLLPRVAARAADSHEQRNALHASYANQLNELANWCERQKLSGPAEQLRSWLPSRRGDQLTLFMLPSAAETAKTHVPLDEPWFQRWQALREAQAEALFALAKGAQREKLTGLVYELVVEAARENPNHEAARKFLGYTESDDVWLSAFESRQQAANKVWHDEFGWLPKAQVERYEKGQRYYQGRWVSVAEEAKLRGDIKQGWRVESEHYAVTTNHSLEEGVRLAKQLDTLYAAWQQAFAGYQLNDAELTKRFEGRPTKRDTKLHSVVYYRTRDEYNQALRSAQPQIDITLGIYFAQPKTAYFFAGDEQHRGTLYHEATHQLFQEARAAGKDVGKNANFWILEGIACYMESLTPHDGYCTLGGSNAGRMPQARDRLLRDQFYVPLNELTRFGIESLQRDPRISMLYSQSAGLADFLMHGQHAAYREALVRYLEAIYTNRANLNTLAELSGVSYAQLDAEYRQFMQPDSRGRSPIE